jgi:hypothetical protein
MLKSVQYTLSFSFWSSCRHDRAWLDSHVEKVTEWCCVLGREATVVSIHGTLLIWARSLWMIKSAEALCTSFGGHDNSKIVDCIQDHGINLVRSSASSWHKTQYNSHFPIWNPVIFTLHTYRPAPHGNWQVIAMFCHYKGLHYWGWWHSERSKCYSWGKH